MDCTLDDERLDRLAREALAMRAAHLEERERRIDAMVANADGRLLLTVSTVVGRN